MTPSPLSAVSDQSGVSVVRRILEPPIMSCWVVPSIAAEIGGISTADVLAQVRDGRCGSRSELGFIMVDVGPRSTPDAPGLTYVPAEAVVVCDADEEEDMP